MHFFRTLLAAAALIASTVAQSELAFTSFPSDVQVGKPVAVTWAGGDATKPVTIKLRKGPSDDLKDIAVLTLYKLLLREEAYTWTPSSSLVDGDDYALHISQGSDINYTNLFSISGGSGSAIPSTDSATLSATPYSSTFATPTTIQLTTGVTTSHISRGTSLSISRNATISTPALSSTRAVTLTPTAAPTESEPSAPTSTPNAAPAILSRPVALALGGLAAFVYLN
ncbi:LOW QUALITY PROTEIN: extracellular matrix protein [Coccidioides immitis RMSCC 3703]|uniref:Extracellular matrix protein n=1 Tax=Coccidioides immitis RMSCC 3703 TaxID=454286 RepID=A0A0J8QU86_COCIT|nr:LOW QUALITY PROTEIN: extracellular matrix protein [Coccidioides immitis RMSCC 3703]